MERFLNSFTGQNEFLFHESNQKHHPRCEVGQIMKIAPFPVKPLITLICRNSFINPVTNKFYFGILVRVANEAGCQSLKDQ